MNHFIRFLTIALLNFTFSSPTYAEIIEEKSLKFNIKIEDLIRGEGRYFFEILTPKKLVEKYPEAIDLDTLSLIYENNIRLVLTKTANIVKRPIGFFHVDQMKDKSYLKDLLGAESVQELSENKFKITSSQDKSFTYQLNTFFDSDDITTLNNRKIIQAILSTKRIDTISQSASSYAVREYSNFSKKFIGATNVTSYISLSEEKTLVISYQITTISKNQIKEPELKKSFIDEIVNSKNLSERSP